MLARWQKACLINRLAPQEPAGRLCARYCVGGLWKKRLQCACASDPGIGGARVSLCRRTFEALTILQYWLAPTDWE